MFKSESVFFVLFLLLATPLIITDGSSEAIKVTLKQGWNMISSPIASQIPITTITSKCTLGDSGASNAIWYWDSALPSTAKSNWKKHTEVFEGNPKIENIEPGKGYWVYVKANCQFDAPGAAKPNTATISLLRGWNMISSPIASQIPITTITSKCTLGDSGASNAIWYWDSALPSTAKSNWKKHTEVFEGNPKIENIEPGKGYWVYVKEPCSFTISAGSDGIPPAPGGTPSTCHEGCATAGDMGSLTTTKEQQTCEIPKGGSEFYFFKPAVGGRVKITVAPLTNNDIDVFAYSDNTCAVDKLVCSATGAGRSTEYCLPLLDAAAGKTYYIRTLSFNHADYDEKAKAKITLELLDTI